MIAATCFFCDDIREEVNGQKTLVGVYAPLSVVETDRMADLHAVVTAIYSVDAAAEGAEIVILRDGQELRRTSPPPELVADAMQVAKDEGFSSFPLNFSAMIEGSSFDERSEISVYIERAKAKELIGRMVVERPVPSESL